MNILVINCGSSSIKYKLYDFPLKKLITGGLVEKIGARDSSISNHRDGVLAIIARLLEEKIINSVKDIAAIGHRVVHGGEMFFRPHAITPEVIKKIEECSELAPLHNPANLAGIKACAEAFTCTPQAAIFDTAFHHSIPEHAYMYAIPRAYYEKYRIRKFGFHGTSHRYVAGQTAKVLKKPLSRLKIITCHLGNGCSITAIKNGKSVDTSMGFTPLEGLVMGTRCGDVDTAAIFYLMQRENISVTQMDAILNRKSGLLGISGVSNDMRELMTGAKEGNALCKLALQMFVYRIKKYIGAYFMVLGGADAVAFSGGIGENNKKMIDSFKKDVAMISRNTKVLVIHTDEELSIAELTYDLVGKKGAV